MNVRFAQFEREFCKLRQLVCFFTRTSKPQEILCVWMFSPRAWEMLWINYFHKHQHILQVRIHATCSGEDFSWATGVVPNLWLWAACKLDRLTVQLL